MRSHETPACIGQIELRRPAGLRRLSGATAVHLKLAGGLRRRLRHLPSSCKVDLQPLTPASADPAIDRATRLLALIAAAPPKRLDTVLLRA